MDDYDHFDARNQEDKDTHQGYYAPISRALLIDINRVGPKVCVHFRRPLQLHRLTGAAPRAHGMKGPILQSYLTTCSRLKQANEQETDQIWYRSTPTILMRFTATISKASVGLFLMCLPSHIKAESVQSLGVSESCASESHSRGAELAWACGATWPVRCDFTRHPSAQVYRHAMLCEFRFLVVRDLPVFM